MPFLPFAKCWALYLLTNVTYIAMQKGHVHQSEERKLFRQILALGYCAPKYFFTSPAMSFLYWNQNLVRNHVKLMHVINSRRGFSMGTVLCGGY